MVIVLYYN